MTMPIDAAFVSTDRSEPLLGDVAPADEPEVRRGPARHKAQGHVRTNSRRGRTDPAQRSYPPVQAVCRAFDVLRTVNRLRIASIQQIHEATGFPKPSIVRMLETLLAEGYVARDNMCGGYWVTSRAHELASGCEGISQIIEIARPFAIELTQQLKWPIGIGVLDGDAIAIKFWTGTMCSGCGPIWSRPPWGVRCSRSARTASAKRRSAACAPIRRAALARRMKRACARSCGRHGQTASRHAIRR